MANKKENPTTKFKIDLSEFKRNIADANRQIRLVNSEFKKSTAGLDDWGKSTDGVSEKLKALNKVTELEKTKLTNLEKQYELVAKEQGENSKSAQDLQIKINNQSATIAKAENQIKKYSEKLADLKAKEDESKSASEKLKAEIESQSKKVDELKQSYINAVLEQGKNSESAKKLKEELLKLSTSLNDNKEKYSSAKSKAEEYAGELKDVGDNAEDLDGSFTVAKGAMSTFVADGVEVVLDKLKEMVTDIGSVETAYNNFSNQTGIQGKELQKYKGVLDDLYGDGMGDSYEDLSETLAQIVQTTKETDPSKIKELANNALVLRDTFGFDVQESMRAVNMLMDQFGVSGEEAFNLIVQGAQNGLNKNDDLLDSINEYSVHYKQLGYNANEFFNSLKNGTDAGTFSVDKLGDTVKEFGIRIKDNSNSTVQALQQIGVVADDNSKAYQNLTKENDTLTTKISMLEQNIKYAKIQQQGFTDSTSALTKTKLADNIKNWTTELSQSKSQLSKNNAELKKMDSESKNGKQSAGELMEEFAKGGTSARKATTKVLKALMNMKNKVKQNEAGVAIFGTMWEDLGIDGVKALMNVNGQADKTKKSMQKINDVAYDDVDSELKVLYRTVQTKLIKPILKDFLPDIEDGIEWTIDNLPTIGAIAKTVGGYLLSIFIGKKVSSFATQITNLITTFSTLRSTTEGLTTAQKLLNIAQSSNPIGAVVAIAGTLVTTFMALNDLFGKNSGKTSEMKSKHDELHDTIQEETKQWQELKKEVQKASQDNTNEFGYYETLLDELKQITTKNGNVKKGYEERSKTITTTLSKALDTEIKNNGHVITSYDNVIEKVQEAIAVKRAEAQLNTQKKKYDDAVTNQSDTFSKLSDAKDYKNKIEDQLDKAKTKLDDFKRSWKRVNGNDKYYGERYTKLAVKVNDLTQSAKTANDDFDKYQKKYLEYINTIENYQGVTSAIATGDIDKINEAVAKMTNEFKTADNATKEMLEKQKKDFQQQYENYKDAIKKGSPGVSQEMVNSAKLMVDKADAELKKLKKKGENAGKNAGNATAKGMADSSGKLKNSTEVTVNKAKASADNKANEFINVGKEYVEKTNEGINKNKGKVSNSAKNAVGEAKKGADYKASEFFWTGKTTVGEITKGINKNNSQVGNASKNTMSKAKKEANKVKSNSVGENFISGLIEGLENNSLINQLIDSASSVAGTIVDTVKDFLGIHSPSKKAMWVSEQFGKGLVIGAENSEKSVANAYENTAEKAYKSANKVLNKSLELDPIFTDGLRQARANLANVNNSVSKATQDKVNGTVNNNTTVNNTFNQTNTSPQPLSRLDIYRDTKNLIKQMEVVKNV
jgi:DNA repair exonuclease SbcCD ATPase subunit